MSSWDEREADLLADLPEHGEEAVRDLEGVSREAVPYDWKAVRGLRNILTHQYGRVDHDALHTAVTRELPVLLERVRAALSPR